MLEKKRLSKEIEDSARELDRERKAQARKNEEYRAIENKHRKENPSTNTAAKTRMAQKRSDDDHRASEKKRRKDNSEIREKNQKRKTQRRKDPDFLEDEKMKKKDKRTNPEDRIKEGQLRRVVRNGPKNRKNIRVDNRNRILKYRKDVLSKITENLAAKQRMRALRRKKECINLKKKF